MNKSTLIWLLPLVVVLILFLTLWNPAQRDGSEGEGPQTSEVEEPTSTDQDAEAPLVGGERDEYGCLGAAGYSYDATIGACVRSFELTPNIAEVARLAVESVGPGYGLTVVSWDAYEEPGAYDIVLERGEERTRETVFIRNGVVVPEPPGSQKGGV